MLVGDFAHRDFSDAVAWLDANTAVRRAVDADEACDWLAGDELPEVTLFAQSRPGQLAQRDVERLHASSPLSRLVVLLGSWCEGEMRTGHPWAGVIRIYWHQWHPQIISELGGGAGRGVWRLPRTASAGEQLACAATGSWPRGTGLVAIYTPLHGDYEALRDACAAGGYASAWYSHQAVFASPATAVLYNAIAADGRELEQLAEIAARHKPAPVIALLDFLRRQDQAAVMAAGAAAALAKPFLVADLLWHLEWQLRRASPAPTRAA